MADKIRHLTYAINILPVLITNGLLIFHLQTFLDISAFLKYFFEAFKENSFLK
jgi:hypothetical protein